MFLQNWPTITSMLSSELTIIGHLIFKFAFKNALLLPFSLSFCAEEIENADQRSLIYDHRIRVSLTLMPESSVSNI